MHEVVPSKSRTNWRRLYVTHLYSISVASVARLDGSGSDTPTRPLRTRSPIFPWVWHCLSLAWPAETSRFWQSPADKGFHRFLRGKRQCSDSQCFFLKFYIGLACGQRGHLVSLTEPRTNADISRTVCGQGLFLPAGIQSVPCYGLHCRKPNSLPTAATPASQPPGPSLRIFISSAGHNVLLHLICIVTPQRMIEKRKETTRHFRG